MNTNENQPPTTAEIVAELRWGDTAENLFATGHNYFASILAAADRLEAYDRVLNNVDGALHSYVLRNLSRLQIAHLIGEQAVTQVNELEAKIEAQERELTELRRDKERLDVFVTKIAKQKPSRPDYWNKCSQCENNSDEANEILWDITPTLDAAREAGR